MISFSFSKVGQCEYKSKILGLKCLSLRVKIKMKMFIWCVVFLLKDFSLEVLF